MYEVGKVYIWQNQVGEYAILNGTETTVISEGYMDACADGVTRLVWDTDARVSESDAARGFDVFQAFAGDLKPKDPPKGEQRIMEMFKAPEMETA